MLSPQRHPIAAELEVSDCYIQSYLSLFARAPLCHYTHHTVAYLAVDSPAGVQALAANKQPRAGRQKADGS